MMGDNFKKVQPGQRMEIPAEAYNAFVDAARDARTRRNDHSDDTTPEFRQATIVRVRNDSGSARARYDILGINSPIIAPATDLEQFKSQVAFAGITPGKPTHDGRFVVLLEPLAAGAIGRAFVAGVCPVQVSIADSHHQYADVANGDAVKLASRDTGAARILWKEASGSVRWAVVEISSPTFGVTHRVTLGAGFAPGASGSVTLPDGRNVTATNWTSDATLFSGDKCLCFEDLFDSTFYLVKSGTVDVFLMRLWHAVANTFIAAGGTGSVTLSTGSVVTATNWSDDVDIESTNKIHVYQDPFDAAYYAIKSGSKGGTRWFKGQLAGTLSSTDTSASVSSVLALDGGDAPSTLTASNWLKLAGQNGSSVAIAEDLSGESTAYLLMQIEHKSISVDTGVEVDSPTNPTLIRQVKRTICTPAPGDDSDPQTVVTLADVAVDTNVKVDSAGTPTKLQQTKRTIKVFPKTDNSADSDVVGIEAC